MTELLSFLQEHSMAILTLLACIIYFALRFIKTDRSYDFLRWILSLIDYFIPDRKSGGDHKFISKTRIRD